MSFGTRPKRGAEGAPSEAFSALSKKFLKQALHHLGTAKTIESVFTSSTCVPELRKWKVACFDAEGHAQWLLENFSRTNKMSEDDWEAFLEFLKLQRDPESSPDKQTPKTQTAGQQRWLNQWLDSARIITNANSTEDGLLCHHVKEEDWCHEICLRLIITACDDLNGDPNDGYFANLLRRSSIPVAVMTTPQISKERTNQPRTHRQKRPRSTETISAHKSDSMPIEDNINVVPHQTQPYPAGEDLNRSPTSARRRLVRGLRPAPSVTSSANMFSNALVPASRSREPSEVSSEADESLEYAPRRSAFRSTSHATRGFATPTASSDTASWQDRCIMEMDEKIALKIQLERLETELKNRTDASNETIKERNALRRENFRLRSHLEDREEEQGRALREVTKLKEKLRAIDEIARKTS